MPSRTYRRWLLAIVLAGLLVRLPGVFWGANFPGGWLSHHPDEYTHVAHTQLLIDPGLDLGWTPTAYPLGTAAHVAAPTIALRLATGRLGEASPERRSLLIRGRLVALAYGVATIVILAATVRLIFRDDRLALLAAALMAVAGLHVSQSHFFLADVPGLFWLLAGLFFTGRYVDDPDSSWLAWAGFAAGAAFGTKLLLAGFPSIALAWLLGPRRWSRLVAAGMFCIAGYTLITMGSYTTQSLFMTTLGGIGDPSHFNRLTGALLYLVEWPSIVGLPVALLGLWGGVLLLRRAIAGEPRERQLLVLLVVIPAAVQAVFVFGKLDHFPRHVLPFIPWTAMAAALALGFVARRWPGWTTRLVVGVVLAYQLAFVVDGERVFLEDPRNDAAAWLEANVPPNTTLWWNTHTWVPGYDHQRFTPTVRPEVLVVHMMDANHYLRGVAFGTTYPEDVNRVFDVQSQERLVDLQALFRGSPEYRRVATFPVHYRMPEYRWVERLVGDRSRNYVSTVVIFQRENALP